MGKGPHGKASGDRPMAPSRNLLELFIRCKTDFTIDAEECLPSGRLPVPKDTQAKLQARKDAAPAPSPDPTQTPGDTAAPPPGGREFVSLNQQAATAPSLPPWAAAPYLHPHPALRLHAEILDLVRWLRPTPAEATARSFARTCAAGVVKTVLPDAHVHHCGSTETHTLHPLSDINLRVLLPSPGLAPLAEAKRAVANRLVADHKASEVWGADTMDPSLELRDARTGLFVHLLFVPSPSLAPPPDPVAEFLASEPAAAPLIATLKFLLTQRGYNGRWNHNRGWVPSHLLNLMVIGFLQHTRRASADLPAPGLGELLTGFLRLYGLELHARALAVSLQRGGALVPRKGTDDTLELQDFGGQRHTVAQFGPVARTFAAAFTHLSAPAPEEAANGASPPPPLRTEDPLVARRPTLLSRVLYPDPGVLHERRRVQRVGERMKAQPPAADPPPADAAALVKAPEPVIDAGAGADEEPTTTPTTTKSKRPPPPAPDAEPPADPPKKKRKKKRPPPPPDDV